MDSTDRKARIMMQICSIEEITKRIREIKQTYRKACSNYYYQFTDAELYFDVNQTEKTIVFGHWDETVYRIYFYTAEGSELKLLLQAYQEGSTIDIVTKRKENWEHLFHQLCQAGYREYALFERHHIRNLNESMYRHIPEDLSCFNAAQYGRDARLEEADQIFSLLKATFDAKESHLQSLEALKNMIRDKHIRVITENGEIVTLLTFWEEGKKLYMEHAINKGSREYMHCLYLGVLEKAAANGINYVYTWINAKNKRVRGFMSRFGYEKEDILDYIFVKGEQA